MLMQGQEVVEASWQAVDECWICVRIVAMWSGCIRDGLCVHVSILGVVCTVTVVATHPQMATQTAGDSEGEDLRQERSLDTGLSGEQIALLMAEGGCRAAKRDGENDCNQSQYDFTDAVLGQVQDALRDLEYGSTEETREAAVHSLQKAAEMLERRMKLIKMADRSEYGWAVVAEYESDELAVDSDDEKRISRAEKEAEKKWLRKRKRQIDDRVDGARGVTGATQLRATSNVGATPRAGPCFGCGEWGHLKRSCPRSRAIVAWCGAIVAWCGAIVAWCEAIVASCGAIVAWCGAIVAGFWWVRANVMCRAGDIGRNVWVVL
eukprot:Em0018g522a